LKAGPSHGTATTGKPLPRLRPGAKILAWDRALGFRQRHFVRDPQSGEVVELGAEAAFVCRRLDGRTDVEELRREYEREFKKPLAHEDLEILLQRLAEAGLLEGVAAGPRKRSLPELFAGDSMIPVWRWRLGEGDAFAGRAARWLGWAFTKPFHALAIVAVLWAIKITYVGWPEYLLSLSLKFSPVYLVLVILLSALLVRSPRSLIHAVQCKRHGRRVTGVGIAFVFWVVPALYFDWFDAARIRDRRERGWVVFAGLYYHLLLWAVATIGWQLTVPGGAPNVAWLVVSFVAAITFLLFTVNPLAPTDAYFLLSNWVGVPRLRERALAAFGSWASFRLPPEVLTRRERRLFRTYGLLCFAYAVLVMGWVGWNFWSGATSALEGAGALLVVAVVVLAVQKPVRESLSGKRPESRLFRRGGPAFRWSVRLGVVGLLVLVGLIPYPYETGGPFLLLPVRETEVHTQIEGQIVRVLVQEGELVTEGQPLATIDPREYVRNRSATAEQLAAADANLKLALAGPKQENVITAERRLQKAQQEVEMARVRHESSAARAQRYEQAYRDRLVTAQEYENAVHLRENDYQALEVARKSLSVAEAELAAVRSGTRPEEIDALQAEVRSLQALLDDLEEQIRLTELRAPVAGRLITPYVDQKVGQYLRTGDLFAKIEESRTIRAEVEVPEEDAAEVAQGARVRVVPWSYSSETFYGTVVSVAPAATEELQATHVRVLTEIPNADGRLKSNMTGYAKIATRDKPLWEVFLWPLIRWFKVQVWYWIP
jgi:putative peptide zinc metalloprotease protein